MSLLLAPMDIPVTPEGMTQLCVVTSHIDKSYRERVILTVWLSPGVRKTLSKPFKFLGADLADALRRQSNRYSHRLDTSGYMTHGGLVYSCGICMYINRAEEGESEQCSPRALLSSHCLLD